MLSPCLPAKVGKYTKGTKTRDCFSLNSFFFFKFIPPPSKRITMLFFLGNMLEQATLSQEEYDQWDTLQIGATMSEMGLEQHCIVQSSI